MSINANNAALNEILETINKLPEAGSGKEEQEKVVDITENGTTEVTPDEGMTLSKVTVNVEVESSGGEDEFIGIKYSNFNNSRNLPIVADARSLDKVLREGNYDDADNALTYSFTNSTKNGNGGYFAFLEEVYLPSKAHALVHTFENCSKLTTIHGDLSNIITIDHSFSSCISLDINEVIARMSSLKTIGNNSFYGCTQITEITLPATITSIHTGAFKGCTNLTKINCLFAEGSVTGAPWGAPNTDIEVVYVTGV